mgnify:CR=1 FL=1
MSDLTSSPSARSSTRCSRASARFHGDSAADTMSAILREDPPEPLADEPEPPPGLERIVRHCLEKNPEQRFQSARDLAFDLESLSGLSRPRRAPWREKRAHRGADSSSRRDSAVLAAAVAASFLAGRRAERRSAPAGPSLLAVDVPPAADLQGAVRAGRKDDRLSAATKGTRRKSSRCGPTFQERPRGASPASTCSPSPRRASWPF